jgi:hypothetical protein
MYKVPEWYSYYICVLCLAGNLLATVEHCSIATNIGLCLRLKLRQSLPPHYKVFCWCGVQTVPAILGSHTIMNCLKGEKKKKHKLPEYVTESMRFFNSMLASYTSGCY